MRTFEEMIQQLKQVDEIVLLEMLNLTSEDLIERCRDIIENDQDRFEYELGQFFGEVEDDEQTPEN